MNKNGMSRISVTAAELTNSRIVSTPCSLAATTPVGRFWKYRGGSLNRWSNTVAARTASTRLPVCSTRYCLTQVKTAVKTMKIAMPIASTTKVLSVWCTTTLSMMACVNSGRPSASNCRIRLAPRTSRQTLRCLSSSGTNQAKPKPLLPAGVSASFAASGRARNMTASPEYRHANSATDCVSGSFVPAGNQETSRSVALSSSPIEGCASWGMRISATLAFKAASSLSCRGCRSAFRPSPLAAEIRVATLYGGAC